ncbi:MAG: PilZ domain-containing protein [Oligoflexia bacterium]|nr:PilZ domain-containing protein [Oligoflexia bacterium]
MADSEFRNIPVKEKKLTTGATKVEDPIEIRKLLSSASETAARADIALPKMGRRFISRVELDWAPKKGLEFEIPSNVEKLEAPIEGECNIIIFLKGQTLACLSSKKVSVQKDKLIVAEPWTIFTIQRRKEVRYEIPKAYEFLVTLDSVEGVRRRVTKRLLDVSASGFAVQAISHREAGLFKRDLIMKNIQIQLEDRRYQVDAQVRNSVPLDPRSGISGFKIGFKILRIKKEDALALSGWVARRLTVLYT